jgi:UPF0755 protein
VLVGVSAGVLLAAFAATLIVFSMRAGPGEGTRVAIDVPEGLTPRELADLLAAEGLTDSAWLMSLYLGLSAEANVVPGEHLLTGGATPGELKAMLARADARRRVKVTIPEGFHRFAIADRLEAGGVCSRDAFLRATVDPLLLDQLEVPAAPDRGPESAEGYLFPATYELGVDSPAIDVVQRMVRESHTRWARLVDAHEAGVGALLESLGWGRREVVVLASIVEKEAAVDEERAVIASVFLNRMRSPDFSPRRLQSDPTSAYGCMAAPREVPSCRDYAGKVTPAMNQDRLNRYSTYVRDGLPPGPIANPGERSLSAVLAPKATSYFYFVASGQGRHRFSETFEEHQRAIRGE